MLASSQHKRIILFSALLLALPSATSSPGAHADEGDPGDDGVGIKNVEVAVASSVLVTLRGRVARVTTAAPDVADVAAFEDAPDTLLITGKRPGATDTVVWTRTGKTEHIRVHVTYPVDAIRSALRQAIPGASKVEVQSAGAAILLSGQVGSVDDIATAERIASGILQSVLGVGEAPLINMMTVAGDQQVQLEVAFAEVSRTALRSIGFNFWSKQVSASGSGFSSGLIAPTSSIDTLSPQLGTSPAVDALNHSATDFDGTTGAPLNDSVPLIGAPISGAFGFIFSSTLGGFPFSAALSLLSSKGYARTMAEPTLVAMSGKSAKFLAGGEFPIPLPQSLGQVAVEYRKFGVQLGFLPTVVGDDIQLNLSMTVSDIDQSLGVRLASTTVPGLTERHSETTVRLKDGQSFVIAGLLSDKVRSSVDKVPWLGDIPVLGTLFRSSAYRRDETELLVVVTAHLVRPLDERPELPGERATTDPNDLELFFLGKSESLGGGQHTAPRSGARQAPKGAVGFQR